MLRSRSPFAPRLASVLVVILGLASGCVRAPDIDYTDPVAGATGVASDTEIVVAFTSELDPETATDPANISVSVSGETGDRDVSLAIDNDGRVITITPDSPLGTAKIVTVVLFEGIRTVSNVPIDEYRFTFNTTGVTANPEEIDDATGRFLVQSVAEITDPTRPVLPPEPILAVIAAPPAEFSNGTILSDNVVVRGDLSGPRTPVLLPGSPTSLTSAGFHIRSADGALPFEPGERVSVVLTESLQAPAQNILEPALDLRPHVSTFEAASGALTVPDDLSDPFFVDLSVGEDALTRPLSVRFADILPNAAPDIVVAEPGGFVNVFSRFGEQSYAFTSAFQGPPIVDLEIVDLEGSGTAGILTLLENGDIEYTRWLGGQFFLMSAFSLDFLGDDPAGRDIEVGDLDGDGRVDALIADGDRIEVLANDPETELFVPEEGPLVPGVLDIEIADLDLDGRLDIVASDGSALHILRGAGDRTFLEVRTFDRAVAAGALHVAPIDGDRAPDIIVGEEGSVTVLRNPGNGTLTGTWQTATLGTAENPTQLASGDFDGNGIPDLIWYDDAAAPSATLRSFGSTFAEFTDKSFDLPPEVVAGGFALADTNRDGARDILFHGGLQASEGVFLAAETSNVIAATPPEFALALTALPTTQDGVARLELSGTIPVAVERLEFFLDLPGGFGLADGTYLEGDFVESSAGLVDTATADGVHIVADFGQTPLTAANADPIATIVLGYAGVEAGEYPVGILPSGTGSGGTTLSTIVELPDGRRLVPDLIDAATTLVIDDLAPTVPPVLAIDCAVDGSGTKVISWVLPDDDTITGVRVSSGGQLLASLPPTEAPYEDSFNSPTRLSYSVTVVRDGALSEPRTCTLPITNVTCSRGIVLANGNQRIDLSWSSPGTYASIEVRRDGTPIAIQPSSGSSTSVGDAIDPAVDCGAHVYTVVGTTLQGSSEAASCVLPATAGCATVLPVTALDASVQGDTVELSWRNGQAYDVVQVLRNGAIIESILGANDPSGFVTTTATSDVDVDPGAAIYQVIGFVGVAAGASGPAIVQVSLPLPTIDSCAIDAGGAVALDWTLPEDVTYDALELLRTDAVGGTLSLGSVLGLTSFTDPTALEGTLTYSLLATIAGLGEETAPCTVVRADALSLEDVVTLPGRLGSIAVTATLVAPIESFSFTFEYDPAGLEITGVTVGETFVPVAPVDDPTGGPVQLEVTATVSLPAGTSTIAELSFFTPIFPSAGSNGSALSVLDPFVERTGGIPSSPTGDVATLTHVSRGIYVDPSFVSVGGTLEGIVYASSNLSLTGYEIAMTYDREVLALELLTVAGTVGDFGFAAPTITTDPLAGRAALQLGPGSTVIPASALIPIAFYRFRVRDDAPDGPTTLALASWSADGDDHTNRFFDAAGIGPTPIALGATVTILAGEGAAMAHALPAVSVGAADGAASRVAPAPAGNPRPTLRVPESESGSSVRRATRARSAPARTLTPRTVVRTTGSGSLEREEARNPGAVAGTAAGSPSVSAAVDATVGVPDLIPPEERTDAPVLTLVALHPDSADACAPGRVILDGSRFPAQLEVRFGGVPGEVLQVSATGHSAVVVPPPASALPERLRTRAAIPVTVLDPRSGEFSTLPEAFRHSRAFLRGDIDANGHVDEADLSLLRNIFAGRAPRPHREDAADVNDDGRVGIADLVFLAAYLHAVGTEPPAPFPRAGEDPTPDGLPGCEEGGAPIVPR